MREYNIALDVMGGDNAPAVTMESGIKAARDFDCHIVFVGKSEQIEEYLKEYRTLPENISIVDAPETIGMDENPALSVRRKINSSINICVSLIKERKVQAIISAGNTGAYVCAATMFLGLLPEVKRPGIAVVLPTLKGKSLLIDAGANIEPKPTHMIQYAIMGCVYSKYILGIDNLKIGLLNIGEEKSKGTEFIKQTHQILAESQLNFIGNVEAKDLFIGNCDVIVCDGFVGNLALKISESFSYFLFQLLKKNIQKSFISRIGALFSRTTIDGLAKLMDYSEYGGAPLLGIDGVCIICHGSSSSKAIYNAIKLARESIRFNVIEHIKKSINDYSALPLRI